MKIFNKVTLVAILVTVGHQLGAGTCTDAVTNKTITSSATCNNQCKAWAAANYALAQRPAQALACAQARCTACPNS